jgi:hypothetical protein
MVRARSNMFAHRPIFTNMSMFTDKYDIFKDITYSHTGLLCPQTGLICSDRTDIFTDMSMFTDKYDIFKDRSYIFTHGSDMLTDRFDMFTHRSDIFTDMSIFTDKYDIFKDRSYIFTHMSDMLTGGVLHIHTQV